MIITPCKSSAWHTPFGSMPFFFSAAFFLSNKIYLISCFFENETLFLSQRIFSNLKYQSYDHIYFYHSAGILHFANNLVLQGLENDKQRKKIKNKLYEDDFPAKDLYEKTDFVKNIFYTNIQKNRQTYLLRRKRQGKENTSFNVWSIKRSV